MATQFLVRSELNAHPLNLRTVLHDGLELRRTFENGVAVFEVSDPDVVIELMIRRNSAAAGGSIDKNSNAGSKKHSRTSSVAEEETAEEPDAKRAANSAGKIASDEPPSDITHSVESGSIIDQLMRRIEETHSRQEIENFCEANKSPNGSAADERIKRILSVSTPNKKDLLWNERYNQLVQYNQKYKNFSVPLTYNGSETLNKWVREQRKKHKQGNIRQDRLQRLNDIGFVWDPLGSLWNLRYNQLIEFKSEYGHCRVPQKYNKNPSLGEWVMEQRSRFRTGTLVKERMAKLNDLDFAWDGKAPLGDSALDYTRYGSDDGD